MCDHCKTYKPMLEDPAPYKSYNIAANYARDIPPIPAQPQANGSDKGCCSWRETCCDGGCCSRVGNCCSTEPEFKSQPYQKPPPPPSYGYGYGSPGMMGQGLPPMTMGPMPERVPCSREEVPEVQLPMCYGGDCSVSGDDLSGASSETGGTSIQEVMSGQCKQ